MNGTAEKKLDFKPRKTTHESIPDAPEGGWDALIPKGQCKVLKTQNGDPRVIIPVKLVKADEDKNESFQGAVVNLTAILFDENDPERRRASNMHKERLRRLCAAVDVDFAEVYPAEITSSDDFTPMFRALEGKQLHVWTVNSKREFNGETIVETELRFKEPGAGLVTKGEDSDDEDKPANRGKKAAAGGKARR